MARLLVVEDSETILLLLKMRLEMAGYEVLTATDGDAALRELAAHRPDLVVLDVMMPGKSGMEVLAEMREAGDATPVIICTAHRADEEQAAAMDAGADAFASKPIDFDTLFAKIEQLIA